MNSDKLIKEILKYDLKHIHHSDYDSQRKLRDIFKKIRERDLKENISKKCNVSLKKAKKIWKKKIPEIKPEFEKQDKIYFNMFPYNIKKIYFLLPILAGLSLVQRGNLNRNAKLHCESKLEQKINVGLRLKALLPEKAWSGIASTLDACKNSKNVHPFYAFSMFSEESEFNKNAVSRTLAVGWGQPMGPTAISLGMEDIYMKGFDEFQKQRKLKNKAERAAYSYFRNDEYAKAIKYKKIANSLAKKCIKLREQYIKGMKKNKDPRLDIDKNIYISIKLMDELYTWLDSEEKDLTDFERDVLVASAYNAGKGAVKKYNFTVPLYNETSKHAWKIYWKYRKYKRKDSELYEYLKENYLNKAQ